MGISGERGKQHIKALPRFGYKCASRIDHQFHPYIRRAPDNGALVRNRRWRRWPAWEASCRASKGEGYVPISLAEALPLPFPRATSPVQGPAIRGGPDGFVLSADKLERSSQLIHRRYPEWGNWERAPPGHLDSSSTSLPSGLGCVLINVPLKGLVRNHPLTGHIADIMESTRLTRSGPFGLARRRPADCRGHSLGRSQARSVQLVRWTPSPAYLTPPPEPASSAYAFRWSFSSTSPTPQLSGRWLGGNSARVLSHCWTSAPAGIKANRRSARHLP